MALSKGRREQLEQAKKNAKIKAKQKQNKALIQQFNSTHKNAPKQTISAKGGNRNTRQSTGTTRSTVSKTRMNGSLGNSFGGSKTGGAKTTTDRRANAARKADAERRQSTTLRHGSNYLTGGSTRKATPYAAAQQVYTPLRSNDRRARAGRAADANRTINARNQMAANTQMKTGTGKTWNEKEERQKAIDTLNANSMAWHNTSDAAEKTRLHAANDRIRKKFGMTYNGDSGATYLPKASGGKTNVSKPVVETARNAAFGQNYQTQEQRQSRYDELNNEIDRMQKQYPYLIAMDMKNRNAGEKLAAVPWLISHPKLAAAGINGDDQYSKMSTTNKKQADAMYQLYKRLNDEADAISKQSAGKAWGSGVANAALNAAGAVENGARYVTSAAENALSGALKLAGKQDAGQFWEDVAKNTVNTSFADSAMQKVNDWAQPVGSAKKAQDLAGSGARMLPGMALGAATGTASKVSSLLDKAPLANASLAAIFGDSAASGAREALNDGASLNQALAYGAGSGLTEVGTEKMFGGIPGLNEGVAKLGSKSRILNKAFDVLGEGVEEAASTLINPYLKRATYDKNAKNATAQELWDSAKGGMTLAGIMQGANAVSERLANRRYGTAPAETTTSIHDANADVRAAEQMDNRLHPNTSQALPTAQRLALPEGNTRTANTLYANENGGVANNLRAFNNADTPDVLYGNMRGDFTSAPDSGSVLFASQNGQVSQTLPTGYLPVGRSGLTKVAAQVDETQTIPRFAVDDAGNPNGGLSDAEMQWAKLLAANQEKTGVSIQQLTHEIVDSTFEEYNQALQSAEQYVRDYTPQGTSVVWNADGTSFRASNNEKWYSDYYKKNGKAPSRAEAAQVAAQLVKADIQRGGGQFISAELAQDLQTALEIQAAANALGENVISAQVVDGNLVVQRGTPAHTANIQDTNARLDRNIISPVMQGATAAPINLTPMQRSGQTQSAPTLADVRQARNDIMPKLTRAGAETVQTVVQTAPPEITQPMQENAQGAAQQADINPKLTKAEVNAESSVGAAETGFDPYSKMVNDYGAIPEGMNPARMVDVPQSTNGTDRVSNVARTIMESGVTPDSLIPALENHVAEGLFSHDVKSLKKTLSGATKTIQKKGWQGAFDQWEEVTDGRRAVTDDDIALGQMMYTAAVEAGDTQTAMKLAGDLAVQGTALGRGVNAFKLLKKTTPEGQLYYLQKAVQKIQQEYQSRFDKQANKAAKKQGVPAAEVADQYGLKLNEDLAKEFLQAETDEARAEITDKIYNDVAQQIPKTLGDRFNAWRYFSMLGNPRTHIRNTMGNVASAIALDASHKVSAAGQKLFLPQEKRTRTLHTSKAAKQFAKADYANVEAELSGNAYKTEMSEIKQRQKLFPKPLQKVMDANTWALDAEDQVFKKKSYIDSMGNFLTARGWDVNNLTEAQLNEARQHAIQDAKIATFQDASALADTLSRLEKKNKSTEVIIGSLVPFKRTPINVAKRSFELSPVGLLKAITYDAVQVKKGNMDATKMIDHIGQGLTGSGVAALGAFLAAQGIFSAGSSDDDKEANFDAGMGQQEYAINIGGKSYTIDWASPVVVPLAMGGELYNALQQKYDDEETAFNQAMATVSRMFDPLLNMTMLSGIGSTISSAAYNKSNPLFGIASNVATNFGGQFVPTLFGQIARTVDNTRRTTYADKNSPVPSSVQKFLQRQANKIPGLSQYQPAYTDVWGREQKNGPDNVFARAAYNFFSPGYLADAKGTQAEKALKELYQATGDNSVLPSKPQKYYKAEDGTKKFLSASDYSKLTSQSGKISLDAIDKLTKSEAYKQMSNDERIEAVADIYKYAKAIAANKVYKKELDGTTKIVSESGIEPGLYYAYKEMEDSLNNDMEGWEARDQVFNAIKADSSLSDQEKNGLYHSLLIKGTSQSQWDKYTEISGKVTAEEYVDAMIQKQAITKEGEDIEKGRASLEATEFSYYLDSKGYTGEKRQALEDTFKFYSMVKADPANYTFDMIRENGGTKEKAAIGEVESAGISAAQYAQIKSAASGVTYEKGKSGAKLAAVAKVVSQNTANYNEYAAVMHALGYKKIDGHYTSGGKLPEESGLNTGINVNRSSASQKTSSAGFVNPTTASNSVVTSGYGGRNAVKTSTGYSSTNHDGIDIGGTGGNLNGQAADSIGGGKVAEVGYDENGYGNYVVVDHGNGYTSLYGHLQKATVKQGDTVSAGQQVGVIGSTGSSTAPHLHLRVHKDGQSIDPRTVIPGYGG
ncbi:peptidoglycan DD-metalloendopeptidase family protein [Butyricicoccus sp. BIOML-A1]|nr:M23 family metallopeptidase [Butyricicoccus sp. BIOML-A1]MZT26488.1 peptidoglycan DD-metalloendopeptidase family protein [Butyricicoccus sp. BIOML-A1]DAS93386.1 MAG TPA: peptidase [Caudoviricetes sp.]